MYSMLRNFEIFDCFTLGMIYW